MNPQREDRKDDQRDEVLHVIEMPLAQAIASIEDGTIRDAKTILGLHAVHLRRLRSSFSR